MFRRTWYPVAVAAAVHVTRTLSLNVPSLALAPVGAAGGAPASTIVTVLVPGAATDAPTAAESFTWKSRLPCTPARLMIGTWNVCEFAFPSAQFSVPDVAV